MKKTVVDIISESAAETFDIGLAIGRKAINGDVFALSGELGSGKTCFTHGLARGLGVGSEYAITSPTFTLMNEYSGRCELYHFDVYRLNQTSELDDIGYDECISEKGVVVIEWAEKIEDVLPEDSVRIKFEYLDEKSRRVVISGSENRLSRLLCDISL